MEFTVRDWMLDLVVFIDPDATVSEALATMRRRYINSVMVRKTKDHRNTGFSRPQIFRTRSLPRGKILLWSR